MLAPLTLRFSTLRFSCETCNRHVSCKAAVMFHFHEEGADSAAAVVILDLHDPEIIADTRRAVYEAFQQCPATAPGECEHWVVSITASATIGRWELGVRGPAGQHKFSFAASPSLVPEFVRHHLSLHLARLNAQAEPRSVRD
jgi:hypothetical protein